MQTAPPDTPASVYVGIGSNLGDKLNNCRQAIELVATISGSKLAGRSGFYRTAPVGVAGQDWYVNCVICILTKETAANLLKCFMRIETELGRERRQKWEPRPVDIDLLLLGMDIIEDKHLIVPHPLMHERRFVLVPMVQLAPDLIHPVYKKTMTSLLNKLSEHEQPVIPMIEE